MHGGKGDVDGYKSGMAGRWGEEDDVRGKEMERCKRRVGKTEGSNRRRIGCVGGRVDE